MEKGIDENSFDSDIPPEEVTCAIKHLKGDKVAGPDGIIPELVKHSTMVEMFNQRIVILFSLTIFVLQVCLNHGRKSLFTHCIDK